MDPLWLGLLLVVAGLLPAALLLLASRRSAEPLEVTTEELALPAASRSTRSLRPAVDSRYNVRASVTAPAAGSPGSLFDSCVCPDQDIWQLFDRGQPLPQPRVQAAHQVAAWRASAEVAAGQEALLAFSNPGSEALTIEVVTERQAIPPVLRGRRGSFFLWAALAGIAGTIAGALLALLGLASRVF